MIDTKILDRVRKLLATAEHPNTPPAEAESAQALAAKLMAKYAVDAAMIDARSGIKTAPQVRQVTVEQPYVTPKAVLLDQIAKAHNVQVVMVKGGAATYCNIVGFSTDLDVVELLYTSLLLQATSAMLRQPRSGRAFRHAFLLSYAQVIGGRLAEATAEAAADSDEPGTALVLRDRRSEVDAHVRSEFPNLRAHRTSASDAAGARSGDHAGRQANLNAHTSVGANRRAIA